MIKVCITGGIGSGKTTISNLFKDLGIPVYNSDERSRYVRTKPVIISSIIEAFKLDDISTNNIIDTKKLGDLVFKDKNKLKVLTDIVAKEVEIDFNNFCILNKNSSYILFESATIIELDIVNKFDYIISVVTDLETRIKRVEKRSNLSRDEIINRINNQSSDSKLIEISDYVIENNDSDNYIDNLKKEVESLNVILNKKK